MLAGICDGLVWKVSRESVQLFAGRSLEANRPEKLAIGLQPASSADQVDQDHDDGEDQENVDETAQRVGGDESENPQDE